VEVEEGIPIFLIDFNYLG